MADVGAMGTAVTNGGATSIKSVSFNESGDEIDITALDDTSRTYLVGPTDTTVTVGCFGCPTADVGDALAVSVAFFDGTTKALTAGVVTAVEQSADVGGAIEGSVTIRPAPAV